MVASDRIELSTHRTNVANLLRGKNKTSFTPNVDCGDYVVIINTDKIKLTIGGQAVLGRQLGATTPWSTGRTSD